MAKKQEIKINWSLITSILLIAFVVVSLCVMSSSINDLKDKISEQNERLAQIEDNSVINISDEEYGSGMYYYVCIGGECKVTGPHQIKLRKAVEILAEYLGVEFRYNIGVEPHPEVAIKENGKSNWAH